MSGRNRMPRHPESYRGAHEDPRALPHRIPMPLPPHPAALEEELELQHRDIQRLLAENRHVIDDNVMLQRDLTSVKDEIHRLTQVIPKMHADKEAQRRELIERGRKLEAELRSTDPLRVEIVQLRADAQKLNAQNKELSSQAQNMTKDINRLQSENKEVAAMKSDIDKMRKDLIDTRYEIEVSLITENLNFGYVLIILHQCGVFAGGSYVDGFSEIFRFLIETSTAALLFRRVYEYEKKGNEELAEQNRALEKNLVAMAREIEKLRAEQASADRRGLGNFFLISLSYTHTHTKATKPHSKQLLKSQKHYIISELLGTYSGAGGYGLMNGSPETRYPGPYGDVYGSGPWGSYDKRGPPRR